MHLLQHSQINEDGGHAHIALELIANMAPVDEKYARETLELCEAVSKIMNNYISQILSAATLETRGPQMSGSAISG